MRIFLLFCVMSSIICAEKTPAPANQTPAPTIDAETIKKAEAAADAYLQNGQRTNARPDPEMELILADLEIVLLECQTLFDNKNPLKAGEKYLAAVELWKKIPATQRPLLGQRLRKADRTLLSLSQKVLGEATYDLGDVPANPGDATPAATPTATQP
jgi:hypothetical protein